MTHFEFGFSIRDRDIEDSFYLCGFGYDNTSDLAVGSGECIVEVVVVKHCAGLGNIQRSHHTISYSTMQKMERRGRTCHHASAGYAENS